MAENNDPTEWYLARDGQQHGPVSEVELEKIIELGYLRPSDLVWRQGMAEWALAESVLDMSGQKKKAPPPPSAQSAEAPDAQVQRPTAAAATPVENRPEPAQRGPSDQAPSTAPASAPAAYGVASPARPSAPAPSRPNPQPSTRQPAFAESAPEASRPGPASGQWEPHPASRARAPGDQFPSTHAPRPQAAPHPASAGPASRQRPVPAPVIEDDGEDEPRWGFPWRMVIILLLVGGLGAGGYALYRTGQLTALPFLGAPQPSGTVPVVNGPSAASRDVAPSPASAPAPQAAGGFEQSLQRGPLWQRLKRDFPEWHKEISSEISRLAADSRSERELQAVATRALIDLRKKHHADALAAGSPRLRSIAQAFVANLAALSRESISACYGFISQGEASPAAADLQSPAVREAVDAQLGAIFDAVVEGRQRPVKHDQPRREDYDALTQQLGRKGWSPPDLQLFMDARALSRAAPEKVCQMVQDWFAAQLAIEDEGTRTRLLSESLKPVVAG